MGDMVAVNVRSVKEPEMGHEQLKKLDVHFFDGKHAFN
jgi:hypothetical protein